MSGYNSPKEITIMNFFCGRRKKEEEEKKRINESDDLFKNLRRLYLSKKYSTFFSRV